MKSKQKLIRRLSNHRNKLARFYDNGGMDDRSGRGSYDRYTAVYLTPNRNKHTGQIICWDYRAMSEHPFHPQGVGLYCDSAYKLDCMNGIRPASLGRKNHLGRRIRFQDLPEDCQKLVIQDLTTD